MPYAYEIRYLGFSIPQLVRIYTNTIFYTYMAYRSKYAIVIIRPLLSFNANIGKT